MRINNVRAPQGPAKVYIGGSLHAYVTIQRRKSVVGALVAYKVYLEDPTADFKIDGVPCRLLGKLKNGESKGFEVDEEARRLFVIAGKMSRHYCFDMVSLPAGDSDLFLSGQSHFSLLTGNPFRFDGEASGETVARRVRGLRRGTTVFCIALVIGILIGFGLGFWIVHEYRERHANDDKTFSKAGMSITLDRDFYYLPNEKFIATYSKKDASVLVVKEAFADYDGLKDFTLTQYGRETIRVNKVDATLQTEEGLTYFEYDFFNTDAGKNFHYYCVLFKGPDAFWMFEFACLTEQFDTYHPQFIEWAKTIQFDE